jgi:hypothetical protein
MREFEITYFDHPSDSYSRQLDNRVAATERPYGYSLPPPPADTNDYDQYRLESTKKYTVRQGKVE